MNDGHVTGVVTSPALPGLAPEQPKAKTSAASEWGPLAKLWLGLRPPPGRPACAWRVPRGAGPGHSPGPARRGEGGRSASRGLTPVCECLGAGRVPRAPASPPSPPSPPRCFPAPAPPPTGAERGLLCYWIHRRRFLSFPRTQQARKHGFPRRSDLLYLPSIALLGVSGPRGD